MIASIPSILCSKFLFFSTSFSWLLFKRWYCLVKWASSLASRPLSCSTLFKLKKISDWKISSKLTEFARFSSQFFLVETFGKLRRIPFQLWLHPRSCACSAFGDCRTREPYFQVHYERWLFRSDAEVKSFRFFAKRCQNSEISITLPERLNSLTGPWCYRHTVLLPFCLKFR